MRAVYFQSHGPPEVLEAGDLPEPPVGAGDVRIRVRACALNHLDLWVRQGWPGLKLAMPHVLGSDVAGVVESVGADVRDLKPGAEVVVAPGLSCGRCRECLAGRDNHCPAYHVIGEHVRGGYAELVTVPRANVLDKPASLTFEQAACIPLVFLTAHQMLVVRANLQRDETVLVQAAGSGVGSAAVQIARLVGARVIATAGSDPKLDRARELGAHETINYERQDVYAEVKRLTGGRGVDVVVEHVGAATWPKSLASLGRRGRLVCCGATTGYDVRIDLRHLFMKHQTILGSTMGSKAELFEILRLVGEGRLRGVLDRSLPLAEARTAHRLLEERAHFGKVVLVP